MDADDHVDHQLQDPEDVRIVGTRVGAVEELEHATDAQHAVDADECKVDAPQQVEQVGTKNNKNSTLTTGRPHRRVESGA